MITSSWKVHYQTFVEAYVTGILCTVVSIITLDVYDPSIHIIKKPLCVSFYEFFTDRSGKVTEVCLSTSNKLSSINFYSICVHGLVRVL